LAIALSPLATIGTGYRSWPIPKDGRTPSPASIVPMRLDVLAALPFLSLASSRGTEAGASRRSTAVMHLPIWLAIMGRDGPTFDVALR
jgi:hypothetical protein